MGEDAKWKSPVLHVFDADFAAYCARRMAELPPEVRTDPFLLGYFPDNELQLWFDVLDRHLALDIEDEGRVHAVRWLAAERQVDVTAGQTIDDDDRMAFYRHFVDTYFSTVSGAIRNADPNHMVLGSRFFWDDQFNRALFEGSAPYVDVVSFNLYRVWSPEVNRQIDAWTEWADRPVIITEWYAKGEDSGLPNVSGAGWLVKDQADRGAFYENFVLGLLEKPGVVGFHWFRYRDNNPDAAAYVDPSNADSNKGFVDRDYQPFEALTEAAARINERVYAIRETLLDEGEDQ